MSQPEVLELRRYQVLGNRRLHQRIAAGVVSPCMCSPTGSGKTVSIIDNLMRPVPQLLLTPRRVLLDQTAKALDRYGVDFGFRASGYRTRLDAPIQLGMIDTEYSKAHKGLSVGATPRWALHEAAIVHIDEIHSQTGSRVQRIMENYQRIGAATVGWTATPREIGHLCSEIIEVITVPELIKLGYLVQPVVFGPDMPDTRKLDTLPRQSNGDYAVKELRKVWNSKVIFGSVLQNFLNLNHKDTPAILFASGVRESQWFAEELTKNGIRSAHVDGTNVWVDGQSYKSDRDAREAVFAQVECGDIRVLCNRFVLREGFDSPCIGHVILACSFGTRSSYVQAVGRGLRPYGERTEAIIQDHGGNWLNHPAIDSGAPWEHDVYERVLSRERIDNIRNELIAEPINCIKCHAIRAGGDTCPVCGHRSTRRSRPVMHVDGTLELVDGPAYRKRRIKTAPTDARDWERAFWAAKNNTPDRTLNQVYCYFAKNNKWRWLPRDLPLMPLRGRHWYVPVCELEFSDLIPK